MSFFEDGCKAFGVVFGATSGLTVTRFSQEGVETVLRSQIPWLGQERINFWSKFWLESMLEVIRSFARAKDLIAGAMWGADLACLLPALNGRLFSSLSCGPLHYRSVPEDIMEEVTKEISALDWYLGTGGANVAFFQPMAQLWLDSNQLRPGFFDFVHTFVPLADFMTQRLANGRLKHDQVMLQSYGLFSPAAQGLYDRFFGEHKWKLAGQEYYELKAVIRNNRGTLVSPVTHDSVPARRVGFTKCPWVLWTGTWIGTATSLTGHDEVVPTQESFEAGIAFEGLDQSRAAITNVAMLGGVYKKLRDLAGLSYDGLAGLAFPLLDQVSPFCLADMPQEENKAVTWIQAHYNSYQAAAAVIKTAAIACKEKLAATAEVLGQPAPKEVAIIGGWAQNSAFIQALIDLGLKVKIPVFAVEATNVGVVAEALVKVQAAPDFAGALEMLAELPQIA